MATQRKMYTVDRFLGINQETDGLTELNMGEASAMENFFVTDGYNLTLRPGIQRVDMQQARGTAKILALWAGHIGDEENESADDEYLVVVDFTAGKDRISMYHAQDRNSLKVYSVQTGLLGLSSAEGGYVKIFPFGSKLYIMSAGNTVYFEGGEFTTAAAYIPLVIAAADHTGGGTALENLNMMSPYRRVSFSADGTATKYTLPTEATDVAAIKVDNKSILVADAGNFDAETKEFIFKTAPEKGVGNVEITYGTDREAAERNRMAIVKMRLTEAYNGSTDTRLFMAGDGSNLCRYSGVTAEGEATPMYFPAMNEIEVNMTGAAVTGIVRHYSNLLVFTRGGGTYTISYEAVTDAEGNTTGGFNLRSANREFGNDCMGQVQTVGNYPRTVTQAGIFTWNITSSYYKDERNAKRISEKVQKALQNLNVEKAVTCDDNFAKTYYLFLNDSEGTALVNRYELGKSDVWCVYKSQLLKNVRHAVTVGGMVVVASDTEIFFFNEGTAYDAAASADGDAVQIRAKWESGYMDFGSDFLRKYSSELYVSVLPQSHSALTITAATDRREEYTEKEVRSNIFTWKNADFRWWTFNTNAAPKINRVRLKVKKFVYYKLILQVKEAGAQATVLGFDQQVRFGSMAK